MVKLLKPGRVVVVTAGRFAGKKAVVLSVCEGGNRDRNFGHATIAGVERPPMKVHKRMSKKKIDKRCNVKAFYKVVNFSHLMPTRYNVASDFDLKALTAPESAEDDEKPTKTKRRYLQKMLKEKFLNPISEKSGKPSKDVIFLRKKLRF